MSESQNACDLATRISPLGTAIGLAALLACPLTSAAAAEPAPLEVRTAQAAPDIAAWFHRDRGWTGGDGVDSIPLAPDKVLWCFADSFIGRNEHGRRVDTRMINNAFAWQDPRDRNLPLRFFWQTEAGKPQAVLRPADGQSWYWPGGGIVVGDRLYLFAKRVRKNAQGAPGFQFDWYASDLLEIENPQDEPTGWKWRTLGMPTGKGFPQLSGGCLVEGGYLHVYGLFPSELCVGLDRPLALARVPLVRLPSAKADDWEFWSSEDAVERWSHSAEHLKALFRDAAAELTVSRVRGIDGLVATYTPLGLSSEIHLRWAPRPEGPWSERQMAYRDAESDERVFLYGAKAHPELAQRDRELVITYCHNTGDFSAHFAHPEIYLPRVVRVELAPHPAAP